MQNDRVEPNFESLSDPSDIATRDEIRQKADALKAHEAKMNAPLDPDFDNKHCIQCESEIPDARLKAVRTDKCVNCASLNEKIAKQYFQ
jgi:RNA polymerase-binding transcription factor DksA